VWRIGIDLGGTKIEGVVLGRDNKICAGPIRIPTPRDDYQATIKAICLVVQQLEDQTGGPAGDPTGGPTPIGVGMPGSLLKRSGLVQNANSVWLNGRPLRSDLEAALGRVVRVANDANCFALSEAIDGAGAGADSVFGVILGTGCGGGLVMDGKLVDGPLGIGGEWGHNPLPWLEPDEFPGPQCWCGRRGCIEAWVSGPAMEMQFLNATGRALKAADIALAAGSGEPVASRIVARHCDRLARGLAHVMNIIDPHVIVLGGGLSNLDHLYRDLPAAIERHLFADNPRVDIRPPRWGDAGGVRGAAWLWSGK
jgi:fructokinase